MKTIWEAIKNYYLGSFIIILIMFILILFIGNLIKGKSIKADDILTIFIISLILSAFIGSLYLIQDKIIRPKRESKLLDKKELNDLINFGLKKENDSYSGYYKNYYLVIIPVSTTDGEWINITTPVQIQNDNLEYIKKLSKKYSLTNNDEVYFFHQKVQKYIKIPDAKKIMSKADILIQDLITNNIKPLKITESES
jgi:hypothetical protein